MGLKSILHEIVSYIGEELGADKAALHREIDQLVTEIERGRAGDEPPAPLAPDATVPTAPGDTDASVSLPGDTPPEPVDPMPGDGGDSSTTPGIKAP